MVNVSKILVVYVNVVGKYWLMFKDVKKFFMDLIFLIFNVWLFVFIELLFNVGVVIGELFYI